MTNLPRTEKMLRHIDRCGVCFLSRKFRNLGFIFCQENLEILSAFTGILLKPTIFLHNWHKYLS